MRNKYMFDLDLFVAKYVTKRSQSMFWDDIKQHNQELNDKIYGKRLLVIGGAGSIGSSFIRAMLPYKPSMLTVVDINENALAELTRNLRSSREICMPQGYITYPMDYDSAVFRKMFRKNGGFDIVANFSAHKHVRSEKDIYSIEALMRNNVLHAKKLLDLLQEYPPEEYFCVSTDKAANPVNIMGASKRIMEDLIFSYSDIFPVKTARFANVAFSNGSLLEGFLKRIEKIQPISAPTDIQRYFVSMEESGQICMLSCMLGDNRNIFFPKLKEEQMMCFDTIATSLLSEHGFEIELCETDEIAIEKAYELRKCLLKEDNTGELLKRMRYPVHYSLSDTSGEKAYEEFYVKSEKIDMDRFSDLGVITNKSIPSKNKIETLVQNLNDAFEGVNASKEDIIEIIKEYLPNFDHIEKSKCLDYKM